MKKPRILILEPALAARRQYQQALGPQAKSALGSPEFSVVESPEATLESLRGGAFDLAIVNLDAANDGFAFLKELRAVDAELPLIVTTARPTIESATAAMRLGAGDYLAQPIEEPAMLAAAERLLSGRRIEAEYELLRRQVERPYGFDDMIGGSPAIRKVFQTIEQVAGSDVDVLVVGETGTGKELIARSIHRRSRRANGPFVPVDCGAIPENLLESEFYGHEKGSFTGAESRRIGLLEFADRGTFFLDELGELPLLLQAKLLRTLQERKIRRVGGREEIDIDVRIVAATARNLDEMIRQGSFRQDLFYRINVVRIDLPPLRERGDDIGLLAEYMAQRYGREMGREVKSITPEAYQVLKQYRWPGNVRELQNVIRRAIALAKGPLITLDDLPGEVVEAAGQGAGQSAAGEGSPAEDVGYFDLRDQQLAHFEKQYLTELLARHHGDVRTAALEAKLPRGTLYRLMKKHELDGESFR